MPLPDSRKLVQLKDDDLKQAFPDWPYSAWSTWRLIHDGKLRCVRIGRRIFITRELIDGLIDAHTTAIGGAK